MDLVEEQNLVQQARRDPEAFGPLFDHYYPLILRYLVRRVGDLALSEDLAAEVFYKALNKLWQFQFRSLPFGAWLYRIATNEIRMYFRGKKPVYSLERLFEEVGFDLPDETDLQAEVRRAEEILEAHQEFIKVQEKLKTLPLNYQEVLALRFFEEKITSEIAEILGKREGTVRVLLHRALEALRSVL